MADVPTASAGLSAKYAASKFSKSTIQLPQFRVTCLPLRFQASR